MNYPDTPPSILGGNLPPHDGYILPHNFYMLAPSVPCVCVNIMALKETGASVIRRNMPVTTETDGRTFSSNKFDSK